MRCSTSRAMPPAVSRTCAPRCRKSSTARRSPRRTAGRRSTFDVGAVNDLLSPFFAAGFYYKTFMWPKAAWHKIYEPFIRRAAGLGVAPTEDDPDHYASRYAHCDVLIVGAGVAGLTAALSAAADRCQGHPRRRAAGSRRRAALRRRDHDRRPERLRLGAGDGGQAEGHAERHGADPHDRVRLLQSRFPRPRRAGDRSSSPSPDQGCCRANGLAGAGEARDPGDRLDRAAHGVRQQRPAGHHAGVGGAHLSSTITASRSATRSASTRRMIRPMKRPST